MRPDARFVLIALAGGCMLGDILSRLRHGDAGWRTAMWAACDGIGALWLWTRLR